jgi:hypothetical protein
MGQRTKKGLKFKKGVLNGSKNKVKGVKKNRIIDMEEGVKRINRQNKKGNWNCKEDQNGQKQGKEGQRVDIGGSGCKGQ